MSELPINTQKRLSVAYLLNRDRVLESQAAAKHRPAAAAASKPKVHATAKKTGPKINAANKAFAFVNYSDPTQAADTDNRKFVRQYVRPVKKTKDEGAITRDATKLGAAGLERGALPFIVMSHPDQGSNAGTRKFVKQNAQRRFRKGTVKKLVEREEEEDQVEPKTNSNYALQPSTRYSDQNAIDVLEDVDGVVVLRQRSDPPITDLLKKRSKSHPVLPPTGYIWNHLNSSGAIFPIEMDSDDFRLVEYLHTSSQTTKVPPAFIPLWFGLILNDPSAFQGLLSLALNHQAHCHNVPTEQKFIQYQSKVLQSVQKRLADPTQHTEPGLLTSIVVLLCHDILTENSERYTMNRAGLRTIIELQGGIQRLDDFFEQRVFILIAEVCGAITFNYTPEYYMPDSLLHAPPQVSKIPMTSRLRSHVRTWLQRFPTRTEIIKIFSDHYAINAEIVLDFPNIWKRPATLSPEVYLVIVRFFHLVNHLHPAQTGLQVETAICMASLLYLNILRDALGCYFTALSPGLIKRLMDAVLPDSEDWIGLESVRLWCLVQGGIVSSGKDRVLFLNKTRAVMGELGCESWEDAIGIVVEIMYVEQLFGKRCRTYGKEVMADEWR